MESDNTSSYLRGVRGDDDVAHHSQLAASTQSIPGHSRDYGLGYLRDLCPVAAEVVLVALRVSHRGPTDDDGR